ncbi:Serine/threonine-protein kinase Nek11 [Anabarilius grahami]|uniref:Serine/threonine-protein kinase Nek11 n=1 Tax=Anabarilius grahami TaxID=495550 RepID=A0A3N0Z467_ANAGA|nr:Serine/threonine-protein kinase Nek11 [Anabarilius grahami]
MYLQDLCISFLNVNWIILIFILILIWAFRSVCRRLGEEVFLKVYDYLKQARQRQESEESIKQALIQLVEKPSDCFEVDQLLYYEELLLTAQENTVR